MRAKQTWKQNKQTRHNSMASHWCICL